MSCSIRKARAADAEAAASMVYSAGPEAFDYMLNISGRTSLDFLRYAFANGEGFQGFRNHWVAEQDGRVVGVGAFYSGRDEIRLTVGLVRQIFAFYPLTAVYGVIRRALELAPMMKPLTRDMLYVANFGVAAESRGQGIGTAMLSFQLSEARKQGFKRYALDVAVTNPRAQKLYEGIGFKLVRLCTFRGDRSRSPVPDCRRLEMLLNEGSHT